MKKRILLISHIWMGLFLICLIANAQSEKDLTPTPPMGWNSYDSYGTYAHEKACLQNLETFIDVYHPLGYEYFVIDGGWYIEYDFIPGTIFPSADKGYDVNISEYGYFIPSETYFPEGFKRIATQCSKNGVKFGVHILRGISRKAYEQDLPVEGTDFTFRDIADTSSICSWNPHTYGVDMTKPGAQAYYDGWIRHLAKMGVEFIKADDIVNYPKEIAAVQKAIANSGKSIVLSLSPGDHVLGSEIDLYEKANMLRVTGDVWDRQFDIDKCFDAWLTWQFVPVREGFWLDMDMIPFGELQVMSPENSTHTLAGYGKHRYDNFNTAQKETFITMRAMSASPLMIGGVLTTMDSVSLRLLTNKQMIACNQNGKMGHLIHNHDYMQIWKTEEHGSKDESGWIAVFNRADQPRTLPVYPGNFGLDNPQHYTYYDVWNEKSFTSGEIDFPAYGCIFIRYKANK